MFPPAPGLFSMIPCCFHSGASREPNERPTTSVAPPGGKGTTMRTSFSGYCAYAGAATARPRRMLAHRRALIFRMESLEFVRPAVILGDDSPLLRPPQNPTLAQLAGG